ncbi:MAG: hypothetical protein JO199_10090 [Candidatus Eremiobacteraeota bacterium]|nr:hypothetical protein [Candidatus Eremiobacteraeota bacterium]
MVTYAAQICVVAYAVLHQASPLPHAFLPIPLAGPITSNGTVVVAVMLALAALQTVALARLYRAHIPRGAIVAGCVAMVALSVCAPVMISADAYAYVADALLGRLAYDPPATAYGGSLTPIGLWWSALPPTPYGPLWLAVAWLVTAPLPSLLGKIVALRVLGAAGFVALPLLLRALGLPARVVAIAALNPGLALEFVASAHNDLFGVVLLLAAALSVRRQPVVAGALLLAGGLVKLPFAVLGLPVLYAQRSLIARVTLCVVVPLAALLLSWIAGGGGFVKAMTLHTTTSPVMTILTGSVALVVVAAAVYGAFNGRRLLAFTLLAPLATVYSLAWYFVWGLPYAASRRNAAAYLLLAFPLAAVLLEVKFMTVWTLFGIVPAAFAWQILAARRTA